MILALRTLSSRLPPSAAAILGVVLLVLVGFGDYETGPEFSFSLFYLVPVLLVTWVAGRTPGMLTSILGALVWLWADQATGRPYSHAALGYWNAGVRLSFFCISAYLLSALRDALRREHALAETDFLTGIANSRSFYRAAEREIARAARYGHPLSIAYIDLDDFKAINDGYGHAKGDELLRSVAEALRTEVRVRWMSWVGSRAMSSRFSSRRPRRLPPARFARGSVRGCSRFCNPTPP